MQHRPCRLDTGFNRGNVCHSRTRSTKMNQAFQELLHELCEAEFVVGASARAVDGHSDAVSQHLVVDGLQAIVG